MEELDITSELTVFAYSLNGTIDGEFFSIETDSKKVLQKILPLMDDGDAVNE